MKDIVGSDEALKGDTFGGIVVAAVHITSENKERLTALGVRDSKRISKGRILRLAKELMKLSHWMAISLLPAEYNALTSEIGTTELLNALHKHCFSMMDMPKAWHVVDKFPGCRVGDEAVEQAESKFIEVAAASVIAKAMGIRQLQYLSKRAGFRLPLGSSHVSEALKMLRQSGLPPAAFVKLNFKNVKSVFFQETPQDL